MFKSLFLSMLCAFVISATPASIPLSRGCTGAADCKACRSCKSCAWCKAHPDQKCGKAATTQASK
jgi:hypothetical protein